MSEARSPVVLLVEDNRDHLGLMAQILTMDGFSPERLSHSADAVTRLNGPPPLAVVLDYFLPGMDGLEFLKLLRQTPGWEKVSVVVSTAADSQTVATLTQELAALKPAVVLRKPFDPDDLTAALRAATGAIK